MTNPAWLDDLKAVAGQHFAKVGFPSAETEEWRHTHFAPITKLVYRPAAIDILPQTTELARSYTFGDEAACELVFVNGRFSPELSRLAGIPRGLKVASLAAALASDGTTIEQHLAKYAKIEQNPFVAWNTGHIEDGALVQIAAGAPIERPIHLLFLNQPSADPAVVHPRTLIVAERGATASIVETYVGAAGGTHLTNAVTEVSVGEDANIDHCKFQQEQLTTFHLATLQVNMGRSANFVSHSITLGGAITRNDLRVLLDGERAYATLNGLVVIEGSQHVDNHTLLDHKQAHCPSHELYKHVLDGKASAVFKGKIFVQKDAQKTDSKQTSKSLLLSDEAQMNSQPALEIYADDVKCTHGSTIGPVDDEMVFYLRSRGISDEAARHLLTYAFAADVTRRIKIEPVRRRIENYMAAKHGLPQDLRITDLGAHDDAAL
ncbi:MAG: Fe-S cluster assembly protein SufD [Tepidisphaerales bacterium]